MSEAHRPAESKDPYPFENARRRRHFHLSWVPPCDNGRPSLRLWLRLLTALRRPTSDKHRSPTSLVCWAGRARPVPQWHPSRTFVTQLS